MPAAREVRVTVEGRELVLSNLDKVFYSSSGFTKRELVDYYVRAAPAILAHLRDRPLTLKRFPDGAGGAFFYEKRCPRHRPSWVRTAEVEREGDEAPIRFCLANDLPTLTWVANLAAIELHTALHRAPAVDVPTMLVLDLDPGPPADVVLCCELAVLVRRILDHLHLAAFAKTSGSKGLQLYLPLNGTARYEDTKGFARVLAEELAARRPDLVVASMKKALRAGKVFVDWSQNDRHKTTVCAWSMRARERPTVSTPVAWEEVAGVARSGHGDELVFEAHDALDRLAARGDLFADVETLRQELPPLPALVAAVERVVGGKGPEGKRPVQDVRSAPRAPRSRRQGRARTADGYPTRA